MVVVGGSEDGRSLEVSDISDSNVPHNALRNTDLGTFSVIFFAQSTYFFISVCVNQPMGRFKARALFN